MWLRTRAGPLESAPLSAPRPWGLAAPACATVEVLDRPDVHVSHVHGSGGFPENPTTFPEVDAPEVAMSPQGSSLPEPDGEFDDLPCNNSGPSIEQIPELFSSSTTLPTTSTSPTSFGPAPPEGR